MSGIVAMLSGRGGVRRELLERATAALAHRGPDGRVHWVDATGSVGLGHTQLGALGVVDRSAAARPAANGDGSIRVVVDGVLCDAERIRAELILVRDDIDKHLLRGILSRPRAPSSRIAACRSSRRARASSPSTSCAASS
jgi:asparagine synthetase B (glutamine-hydrolysing)